MQHQIHYLSYLWSDKMLYQLLPMFTGKTILQVLCVTLSNSYQTSNDYCQYGRNFTNYKEDVEPIGDRHTERINVD